MGRARAAPAARARARAAKVLQCATPSQPVRMRMQMQPQPQGATILEMACGGRRRVPDGGEMDCQARSPARPTVVSNLTLRPFATTICAAAPLRVREGGAPGFQALRLQSPSGFETEIPSRPRVRSALRVWRRGLPPIRSRGAPGDQPGEPGESSHCRLRECLEHHTVSPSSAVPPSALARIGSYEQGLGVPASEAGRLSSQHRPLHPFSSWPPSAPACCASVLPPSCLRPCPDPAVLPASGGGVVFPGVCMALNPRILDLPLSPLAVFRIEEVLPPPVPGAPQPRIHRNSSFTRGARSVQGHRAKETRRATKRTADRRPKASLVLASCTRTADRASY